MRTRCGNLGFYKGTALPELRYDLGPIRAQEVATMSSKSVWRPSKPTEIGRRIGRTSAEYMYASACRPIHFSALPDTSAVFPTRRRQQTNNTYGTVLLSPSFVFYFILCSKVSSLVMAALNSIPDLNVAVQNMRLRTAVRSPRSYKSFSRKYAHGRETPYLELEQDWDKIDNRYHQCSHSCWPRSPHHYNN